MKIFVKTQEGQKGPYTPSQVQTMWDNGILTADALYRIEGVQEWRPLTELQFSATQNMKKGRAPGGRFAAGKALWIGVGLAGLLLVVLWVWGRWQGDRAVNAAVNQVETDVSKDKVLNRFMVHQIFLSGLSKQVSDNMQALLEQDVPDSRATRSEAESIELTWDSKDGETSTNVAGYTCVYKIFWPDTDGTEDFIEREDTVDVANQKVVSHRILRSKGIAPR